MVNFRETWDSVYIALKTNSAELGLGAVLQEHYLNDSSGADADVIAFVYAMPSALDYVDNFDSSESVSAVEIIIFISARGDSLYDSICKSIEAAVKVRKFLLGAEANLKLRARESSRPTLEAQYSDKSISGFSLFAEYAL